MRLEKAVIAIMLILGIFLFIISLVSMYNDFSTGKPLDYIFVDVAFLLLAAVITGGGLKLYRKLVMFSVVTQSAFEEVIYSNLRPLLQELAFSTAEFNEVKTRVSGLERKISHIEEELTKPIEYEVPSAPADVYTLRKTAFYMRTIVVSLFFFGTYLFLLDFNLPNEPYLYTILYMFWWVFITKEFDLFSRVEAWVILGIPILLVPAGALILRAVLGIAMLMGIIFITSVVYAYLYYQYAKTLSIEESEKMSANGYRRRNFLCEKIYETSRGIKNWFKK